MDIVIYVILAVVGIPILIRGADEILNDQRAKKEHDRLPSEARHIVDMSRWAGEKARYEYMRDHLDPNDPLLHAFGAFDMRGIHEFERQEKDAEERKKREEIEV